MSMMKPEPIPAVMTRATTETPPKGAEIHRVPRPWGKDEVSFRHRRPGADEDEIIRMQVAPETSDAEIMQIVARRKAQVDTPPDRAEEIDAEIALHQDCIDQLRAEREELDG